MKTKTWAKKTAGQLLAGATPAMMAAGNAEITSPQHPGVILALDDDGALCVRCSSGLLGRVAMDDDASERYERLAAQRDALDLLSAGGDA